MTDAPMADAVRTGVGYLAAKAAAVRQARSRTAPVGPALEALRRSAGAAQVRPSLQAALAGGDRVALIAEFKRRSPSGGRLQRDVAGTVSTAPGDAAALYVECGARAVSILTDAADFDGSLDDLSAAAARVDSPVLRKDFIVDAAGLYEARLAGAAAALLIVGILTHGELTELLAAARDVALECLVEVHDEAELERALAAGAGLVGINNRDLRRLTTDLAVTERLAPSAADGVTLVSESGIRSATDVARVRDAGAHAVLVGEALLRLPSAARCGGVRSLAGVPRRARR
jgi:indole-3-glycerol phosphate synthase